MGRNELAADVVNGVYVCENAAAPKGRVLYDMEFYDILSDDFDGVVYGNVSDEIAELIEREYGVY